MKLVIGLLSLFTCGLIMAKTLETDKFRIDINCLNTDSSSGCQQVSYDAKNKETGETFHLIGRQIMNDCKGKTPCHSLGYEFSNGTTVYFVSEDGQLRVTDGSKVLVDEQGEWTYQ